MNKEKLLIYFKNQILENNQSVKCTEEEINDVLKCFNGYSDFLNTLYRSFTQEELIQFIKNKETELGRLPFETDIYIPTNIFKFTFGSWGKTIKAVNKINNPVVYRTFRFKDKDDEYFLNELRQFYNETGRIPRGCDLKNIKPHNYRTRFGTFKNALIRAGIIKDQVKLEDVVFEKIGQWISNNKKFPLKNDFYKDADLPSLYELDKLNIKIPYIRTIKNHNYIHIKQILVEHDMSQGIMERILNVDARYINKIVNNKMYIKEETLERISYIFNINKNIILPQVRLKHICPLNNDKDPMCIKYPMVDTKIPLVKYYNVRCNRCNNWASDSINTNDLNGDKKDVQIKLEEYGWKFVKGKVLCNNCLNQKRGGR